MDRSTHESVNKTIHAALKSGLTRRRFVQLLAASSVALSYRGTSTQPLGAVPRASVLDTDALVARIETAMADRDAPGVAVGMFYDGATFLGGVGLADRATTREVDPDMGFAIASITKTYTAMAAMRLVEQGRLRLDIPIRRYLPGVRFSDPAAGELITMRHLLTHTAGLARDAPSFWPRFGDGDDARARMIERFVDVPQRVSVGSRHLYSNIGMDLAGRVIEVAAATPFEAFVRSTILQPLSMKNTSFFASEADGWTLATGYGTIRGKRDWPAFHVQRFSNADSGLVSTARDQLRYARYWLGERADESVLSQASMAEMITPQAPTDNGWIGLGWFIDETNGERIISHSGLVDGFASRLTFVPSRGFAVVLLVNGDDGNPIPSEVTDWVLDEYLGLSHEA